MMKTETSSHPILSYADSVATKMSDSMLLVGRILIASVFVMTAWGGSPNVGYITALGLPNPEFWSALAVTVEWIIGATLVLGVATRYGAILAFLYVVIATVLAHRYWQYPAAQQTVQYIFGTKNLSILGGILTLFIVGPGRWSIDSIFARRS
jgi:putative oxidoreductase